MGTSDAPVGFTILDQQHTEEPNAQGQIEGSWRVDFETPSGVKSFIRIPDAFYSAENVNAEITDRVAEIERVQALGNG